MFKKVDFLLASGCRCYPAPTRGIVLIILNSIVLVGELEVGNWSIGFVFIKTLITGLAVNESAVLDTYDCWSIYSTDC